MDLIAAQQTKGTLNLFRLSLAIALAAIIQSLPLIAITFIERPRALLVCILLATSASLWLIGGAVLTARHRHRAILLRKEFWIVGTIVASLFPVASILVVQYIAPLLTSGASGPATGVPFFACFIVGVFTVPFGLFSGSVIRWLSFTDPTRETGVNEGGYVRRWRDLRGRRLIGSLSLAPIPAALATAVIMIMISNVNHVSGTSPGQIVAVFVMVLATSEVLAIVGGATSLYAISRGHGEVSREACLVLGGLLALGQPAASFGVNFALGWLFGTDFKPFQVIITGPVTGDIALYFILGCMSVPLGLAGGWLIWQCGIAPAPVRSPDPRPAFD